MRPAARLPSALAITVVLAVSGCGDDAGGDDTTAASGTDTTATTGAPGTTDEAAAAPRTVSLRYAGGAVTGGSQRVTVDAGEEVRLEVTSDVDEEVHVHGYDLVVPVAAGETAAVDVVGDLPGVWEVELHESGDVLAELVVSG